MQVKSGSFLFLLPYSNNFNSGQMHRMVTLLKTCDMPSRIPTSKHMTRDGSGPLDFHNPSETAYIALCPLSKTSTPERQKT